MMPQESIEKLIKFLPQCTKLETFAISFVTLRICDVSIVKNLCKVLTELPNLKCFYLDYNYFDQTFGRATNGLDNLDDLLAICSPNFRIEEF